MTTTERGNYSGGIVTEWGERVSGAVTARAEWLLAPVATEPEVIVHNRARVQPRPISLKPTPFVPMVHLRGRFVAAPAFLEGVAEITERDIEALLRILAEQDPGPPSLSVR